jgi:hypothetical protein
MLFCGGAAYALIDTTTTAWLGRGLVDVSPPLGCLPEIDLGCTGPSKGVFERTLAGGLNALSSVSIPELLTVREVAAILKVSQDTAVRKFESFPGVINMGTVGTNRKRGYKVLRIPQDVLLRYLAKTRVA